MAINYSEELLREEYAARTPIREALQSLASQEAVHNQDVLEPGSGLGYNLEVFASNNRVLGVEGLPAAAGDAVSRGIPTIEADLSSTLPLATESFDVVLCLDVLEHLQSPVGCLREVHRVLRGSGLLIVNVPNHFSLSGRVNILRGSGIDSVKFFPGHPDWDNPHVRFFRHSSLLSLLTNGGFKKAQDWSDRFPSIPLLNKIPTLKRSKLARALAKHSPELFAGGFFIIARKQSPSPRY